MRANVTDEEIERWNNDLIEGNEKIYSNRIKADLRSLTPEGEANAEFLAGEETLDRSRNNNGVTVVRVDPRLSTQVLTTSRESISDIDDVTKLHEAFVAEDTRTTFANCDDGVLTAQNCSRVKILEVRTSPSGLWSGGTTSITNLRQIIVLPPGVDYIDTLASVTDNAISTSAAKPEVIENYQNTGLTALIYSYGDVTYDGPSQKVNEDYNSAFLSVDTSKYANYGPNEITAYSVWDNSQTVKAEPGMEYPDALDLNNNGATDEVFSVAHRTISLSAPLEVLERSKSLQRMELMRIGY